MRTSKSPWTVMRWAHELGRRALRPYASKFSRRDFTLAQLFACLVLRETLGLSSRGVEAILRDADWCQRLGMRGAPDHSTMCRAFKLLITTTRVARMLDLVPHARGMRPKLGRTLAVDSTLCETHHRSRHYERRCRHHATSEQRSANARRSRSAKRTPKLSIGVDTRTHLILSAKPKTGMGSDAPDFHDALYDAWTRHDVKTVLADAGYDSEANHRLARLDMNVRSLIKTGVGRPTTKAASGDFRRLMQRQLRGSQAGKPYGQRAQVECVMSMMKRHLGDALRARSTHRRKMELLLKVVTHNLMIRRHRDRGSQQSPSLPDFAARHLIVYRLRSPRCRIRSPFASRRSTFGHAIPLARCASTSTRHRASAEPTPVFESIASMPAASCNESETSEDAVHALLTRQATRSLTRSPISDR